MIWTMFKAPRFAKKTEYVQFNLDTPLTFLGNNQTQRKSGMKFSVQDRGNFYDWYNASFTLISNSKSLPMVVTWLATPNQCWLMSLFLSSKVWQSSWLGKMFMRPLTLTRSSLSKTCWTGFFGWSLKKRGQEPVLAPGYRRHHRNSRRQNKPRNQSNRRGHTRGKHSWNACAPKPLLILWGAGRPATAANAAGVQNVATGW